MKPDLGRMEASTLELVRRAGSLPWLPGGSFINEAPPLTRSHRQILRDLARQGLVSIDEAADLGIGRVTYTGPELSGPGAEMAREIAALESGMIYVVPTQDLKRMAMEALRGKGVAVVCFRSEGELWQQGGQGVASLFLALRTFCRPIKVSAAYKVSAALSINLRELNGERLPDADESGSW